MNLSTEIGKRIRFYRNQCELTQEELAEKCDVHPTYIGQLERGEKTPSLDVLFRISKHLQVSMTFLLDDVETILSSKSSSTFNIYQRVMQLPSKKQKALIEILDWMDQYLK
ncbi:MAG: helix-turn-helix transcriptional regulator [Lachnospiraceae bacterium]|jgi:transcriptional regulator with XRE-family HTH domain|nr:helix-turn-helix transcriptional regulator [Lachnospiraceae bacterium]